jgi:ABC-2 type transport system permease protein
VRVLLAQCRYEQRSFWRSPLSVVSSIGFTPIFILLIAGITGDDRQLLVRFLPGVVTISAMSICVTSVAVNLSYRRDQNILKRFYATPVPPWIILLSVVLSAAVTTVLVALASLVFVVVALDVDIRVHLPAFVVATLGLAAGLAWLGCALSRVPSQSVVAVANLVVFPALFVSGTMFPLDDGVWYAELGQVLPSHHARQLMAHPLDVDLAGLAMTPSALGMALWAATAAIVGIRTFRWHSTQLR